MDITITVPNGRGKASSKVTPWAKLLTSVERNATSGHGYHGTWITIGSEIEASAGDMIAVQDADACGCAIYVLTPNKVVGDRFGNAVVKPGWVLMTADGSRGWAAKCCAETRRVLGLSVEDRVLAADAEHIALITERRAAITPDHRARYTPEMSNDSRDAVWWTAYFDRLLSARTQPDSTRQTALDTIKKMVAEHGVTAQEIFTERSA